MSRRRRCAARPALAVLVSVLLVSGVQARTAAPADASATWSPASMAAMALTPAADSDDAPVSDLAPQDTAGPSGPHMPPSLSPQSGSTVPDDPGTTASIRSDDASVPHEPTAASAQPEVSRTPESRPTVPQSAAYAEPTGAISTYWLAQGGAAGWLGTAQGSQTQVGGGWSQQFTGGTVHWSSATGAHVVKGAVLTAYAEYSGAAGRLGLPLSDEVSTRGGVYQKFQGGTAYYSSATGAHFVWGAVFAVFSQVGWELGALGFPWTDEVAVSGGVSQTFSGGTIYYSPQAGAHVVKGAISSVYARYSGGAGRLGFPLSEEISTHGGVYQKFQGGTAYYSPVTGAHFIWGYFYNRYAGDGWELGARGFPTSDEYQDRGVTRQDFQHGSYWYGAMPAGFYTHDMRWAGQPNGYFCGPTSGYMILATVGATWSAADDGALSIDALASPWYMNTVGYGYTSFHDRRFEYGMNRWLGRLIYHTVHTPSTTEVRNSVLHSFETGYPTAVDEQERRGGPHFNDHANATFSHIMVVNAYDSSTDGVSFADPGQTLWGGSQRIFWYPSLTAFTQTYLQQEIIGDGRQHIGIYTS